jgi:arsenite-transporting ATPase
MVAARDLILDVEGVREVLADAKGTSIRLVLNLEKMVIKEAQRAFTYFNLFGYTTDLIIVNRVPGDDVGDGSLAGWKRAQEKYRALVDEAFSPLPIRSIPLYDREAVGTKMLARVAADLFGEDDPAARFYVGSPQQIEKRDGAYVLTLTLPFVTKDQVQVLQSGGELTVKVGGYKRNVILPRALVGLEAGEARFRGQNLAIAFRRRSARG